MATDLESLRAKLKARKGKPGYSANIAELERAIAEAEAAEAANEGDR